MVLSFFFLRSRFKIINFMGVALSLVGILSLVLADIQGSRAGRGRARAWGRAWGRARGWGRAEVGPEVGIGAEVGPGVGLG